MWIFGTWKCGLDQESDFYGKTFHDQIKHFLIMVSETSSLMSKVDICSDDFDQDPYLLDIISINTATFLSVYIEYNLGKIR